LPGVGVGFDGHHPAAGIAPTEVGSAGGVEREVPQQRGVRPGVEIVQQEHHCGLEGVGSTALPVASRAFGVPDLEVWPRVVERVVGGDLVSAVAVEGGACEGVAGSGCLGAPGAGGSPGFADPAAGIGYAYITNRIGTYLTGAPCDVALRDALYAALRSSEFIKGR